MASSLRLHLHVVTNSEVTAFRQCKARHGFAYIDLLRPLVTPLPLAWGDLYHAGAEAGWFAAWEQSEASTESRLAAALSAAPVRIAERAAEHIRRIESGEFPEGVDKNALCEETEESAKVASWSVGHYFSQARTDLSMVPILIEGKFETRIPNNAGQVSTLATSGKMDLLLWDRELGRVVVQDHKGTGADVHGVEKRLELDTQLVGYVCAAAAMVPKLQGNGDSLNQLNTTQAARLVIARGLADLKTATIGSIAFNVVRRRMPASPNLNLLKKSQCQTPEQVALLREQEADGLPRGEVSVAQIDTLVTYYQQALEAQIMERSLPATEKQLALLEKLKAKGNTFFAQVEYFKGREAIERWRNELWAEARLMRQAEREPWVRTRNPMACTLPSSPTCPYSLICKSPGDPIAIKAYRVATTKHEELADGIEVETESPQETEGW